MCVFSEEATIENGIRSYLTGLSILMDWIVPKGDFVLLDIALLHYILSVP